MLIDPLHIHRDVASSDSCSLVISAARRNANVDGGAIIAVPWRTSALCRVCVKPLDVSLSMDCAVVLHMSLCGGQSRPRRQRANMQSY